MDERGTKPVIPNRCNRKKPFSFSKRLYKLRWRIENAFNRLKDFRRVATRYDKLARNYLASVCLAAAPVWWLSKPTRVQLIRSEMPYPHLKQPLLRQPTPQRAGDFPSWFCCRR